MNSKGITLALSIALIVLAASALLPNTTVKAQTRTIIVPDDYSDIQTAINCANNGDTVFVRAGTYTYNEQNTTRARPDSGNPDYGIMVNKSISLIGENKNTIISMNYQGILVLAVCLQADRVTFTGFTVIGNPLSKYYNVGSVSFGGSDCLITNNDFEGTVYGTGYNANITYNNFEGADNYGIIVTLHNGIISHNNIAHNYLGGIIISDSSNVIVEENNINGNGIGNHGSNPSANAGVGISLVTYNQNLNKNISIHHNNITDNARCGIRFNGITSNSSISNNNITNNGVGVNLSKFPRYSHSPEGNGTKIFYNNIISNSKNADVDLAIPYDISNFDNVIGIATDTISWDNGIVGNHWSDYNGNGSYVINENNIDHHPLIQQINVDLVAPTATPTTSPTINNSDASLEIAAIAIVALFVFATSLLLFKRHRKATVT